MSIDSSRGTAFTPGPWRINRDERHGMEWNLSIGREAEPNIEVCSMFHTLSSGDDNAQGEANARLIAAAPELLEALRVLAEIPYEAFNDVRPEHVLMGWNKHYLTIAHVQAARAAIAKATSPQRAPDNQETK